MWLNCLRRQFRIKVYRLRLWKHLKVTHNWKAMFKTFKSFRDNWIDKNCKALKAFPNQKMPPCKWGCHSPVNFFDQKMDISISHRLRSFKILWMHFFKRLLVNRFSKKVIFKLGRRIWPFFKKLYIDWTWPVLLLFVCRLHTLYLFLGSQRNVSLIWNLE